MENLIESRDDLLEFVANNYMISLVGFILIYIVAVAFSLPGAAILSLAGGLLFGLLMGLIAVNIAATIGASLNFILARYIMGESLQKKYGDKLKKFNEELDSNGKSYLLTLRLIPVFPFFLINLLAGLTNIKLSTFIWTTSLGIIPGSVFYIYAGTTLKNADSVGDILNLQTIIPLIVLALIAILPVLVKKIRKQ
jgi:uncharacterized membrane protein YdjX (TVP38/TMEM64 family)